MDTQEEIYEAIENYRSGKMGSIDPEVIHDDQEPIRQIYG